MSETDPGPVSRSLAGRSRLPTLAGVLWESEDIAVRLQTAATLQRDLALVLRDDVRDAFAAGWSVRDVAAVLRMPAATLHRVIAAGQPVSVVSNRPRM